MPKKFKGVNTKAEAARERKATAKAEEDARRQKAAEDEYWRDDDKHAARKQLRKSDREQKRQEQLDRKLAVQAALEEEERELGGSSKGGRKVTQAEIRQKQAADRASATAASGAETSRSRVVVPSEQIEENPNRLVAEHLAAEGAMEARSVTEAIAVLGVAEPEVERHPERRMKASYAAFEERRFAELKAENPSLRQSQVRQILRKEWQRSLENPMNQAHASYNAKK